MANYNELKAVVDSTIRRNGVQAITGTVLNSVLNDIIETLGEGYQFAGVATPVTMPSVADAKLVYIAGEEGEYEGFAQDVERGEIALFFYDDMWQKVSLINDLAYGSDLSGFATTAALEAAVAPLASKLEVNAGLATKQNIIADLDTIREGASKGASAYQLPSSGIPVTDLTVGVRNTLASVAGKQDALVSGVNVKTINNISILGGGNIDIQGGGGDCKVIEVEVSDRIDVSVNYMEHNYAMIHVHDESRIFPSTCGEGECHWLYEFMEGWRIADMSGFDAIGKTWEELLEYADSHSTPIATIADVATKQDTLVSGENIKTINGESVLGSGNLVIQGGGSSWKYKEINITEDTSSLVIPLDSPAEEDILVCVKSAAGVQGNLTVRFTGNDITHYLAIAITNAIANATRYSWFRAEFFGVGWLGTKTNAPSAGTGTAAPLYVLPAISNLLPNEPVTRLTVTAATALLPDSFIRIYYK